MGRGHNPRTHTAEWVEDQDWQVDALCSVDKGKKLLVGMFFGISDGSQDVPEQEAAKALCQRCPVQKECLEFAMITGEKYGIWGGLNHKERAALRRKRALERRRRTSS